MNNYSEEREGEDKAAVRQLKTLEDMLHNRIAKKKVETHKYHEIAETEKLWTEIETLHWVLLESLSIRRRLDNEGRHYY